MNTQSRLIIAVTTVILLFITQGLRAQAQQTKMVAMAEKPIAMNMKQYASTPAGIARLKEYGDKSTNVVYSAPKHFADGSSLSLQLVKNPSFGGQATSFKPDVNKDPKTDKSKDSKGKAFDCTTEHIKLTAQSTTFLNNDYSNLAGHIYPGAIYDAKQLYNGNYKEKQGDRNPQTIITDNTNIKGNPYITVKDPDIATIRAAVDELFHDSRTPVATESLAYQIYETSTMADEALKVSGGVSGYGVSLSAGYNTSSHSKTRKFTIDAIKTMFSISTVPPEHGFFKGNDKDMEKDKSLVFIGNVSYGVRVLANITLEFDSEDEAAAFSASYSGWGVTAKVDFGEISRTAAVNNTVNCYIVGGPGNSTLTFNKKDLQKQIEEVFAKTTYKNAMPVKYELYTLAGELVGSQSATDEFPVRHCTLANGGNPNLVSAMVTMHTSDEAKDKDDKFTLVLTNVKGMMDVDKIMQPDVKYFAYKGSTGMEFQEKTSQTRKLVQGGKPLTLNDFSKDGGELIIRYYPDGGNEWNMGTVDLDLTFDDGNTTTMHFSNIRLSSDTKAAHLYFNKDFKEITK